MGKSIFEFTDVSIVVSKVPFIVVGIKRLGISKKIKSQHLLIINLTNLIMFWDVINSQP